MTLETLKNLLQRAGLSPNKTYGQHFLMDETILEDMLDVAAVSEQDTVIEVGPGIGNLTERLLARAGQVLSLEKDPQFERVLRLLKKHHSNFEYELIDALKFNFVEHGPAQYKVVANIPYYITGKIVQLFLQQPHKPESLTLLMQKEVAQNIVAKPGQLNLLAISVQLYGEAKLVSIVPAHKFYPKPKVDSAVIHIELHKKPKYQIEDEKKFFRVLRSCFAGKRKQIHNTLVNNLGLEKAVVAALLDKLKIEPRTRPQQLTIQQWVDLVDSIIAE
jgi:16S rRNA (adenine1518-N6/adenine1519-N6)-dimethyltransferase